MCPDAPPNGTGAGFCKRELAVLWLLRERRSATLVKNYFLCRNRCLLGYRIAAAGDALADRRIQSTPPAITRRIEIS